jgi:hypothetical protein
MKREFMQILSESTLVRLLREAAPSDQAAAAIGMVDVHPSILAERADAVPRAVLAQALNLLLFIDLLERVPSGRAYVEQVRSEGRRIRFDHGALRTVALSGMGDLPSGDASFARILEPLGYRVTGVYPLARLGMTGRGYTHMDLPEDLPQFFVSELHPERFSQAFQEAVRRVTDNSRDPFDAASQDLLGRLASAGELPQDAAVRLLPVLRRCFGRHHDRPHLADYECLLSESAEMAWISTEGNAFNHVTDRVADIMALVEEQRALGRPLKDQVEVSRSGRVRQTAFKADAAERQFVGPTGVAVTRSVPGSFYEFIQRDVIREPEGQERLDLAFDAGNAQGIFKMTASV